MGEMADFLNEQIQSYHEDVDNGLYEPELEGPFPDPTKTCRCCGHSGLKWGRYQGKWRLFEQGKLHLCPKNPLKQK